jgi:uncharacterized protein (TIGR02118 family)
MITRIGMAAKADGLSHRDFQAHWRSSHADATLALPGLRAYVQLPAELADDGEPVLAEWGAEAVGQLDFDDPAAMDAAFASDEYATTVKGDEAQFIDKTRFRFGVYEHEVVTPGETELLLLLGWPEAPESVEHAGPQERWTALPVAPSPFTRVDALGAADVDDALALAERFTGARRLLAAPNVVL